MKLAPVASLGVAVLVVAMFGTPAFAAYCSVSTHNPFLSKKDNSDHYNWYTFPASALAAKVEWQAGENIIDGVKYGPTRFGPEWKFGAPGPVPRVWTGHILTDKVAGTAKPYVQTASGLAGSFIYTQPFTGITVYYCKWSLFATIDDNAGASRCYGISYGWDPWPIYPSALPQDTSSAYALYIPLGMIGASAGEADSVGRFEYQVNYVTYADTTRLLDVRVTEGYVQATSPDHPDGLSFYTVGSQDTLPTVDEANLVSLDGIRSALQGRMNGAGFTDSLVIGILWRDVPKPSIPIADSTLAEVHVRTDVELGSPGTLTAIEGTNSTRATWLAAPQPNPAGSFALRFWNAEAGRVRIQVFDVTGRLVREIANRGFSGGEHRVRWDGSDALGKTVPAGVYVVRLLTDTQRATRRVVVVR